MHLSPEYWISSINRPDKVLLESSEIASMVRQAFVDDLHLVELASLPDTFRQDEVTEMIVAISQPDVGGLRYRDGERVSESDFDGYVANCNLGQIPASVNLRFGLIVERADMRTWPTTDAVYRNVETIDLDRFQENGLFPGDAVAVLHESADGQWYFVQSYNYAAWIPTEKVALGTRSEVIAWGEIEPFLVITGDRVITRMSGDSSDATVHLEMGTRLPLSASDDTAYVVSLPSRAPDGKLCFRAGVIASDEDVEAGYLPYTRRNIIEQAFKFLGEPYGWGHSLNARDCTGLVLEVHKTFGFVLPRNSGQQGYSPIGENLHLEPGISDVEKLRILDQAEVGDLLYSPGHVMLYLGRLEGEHHVIHDVSGSGMADEDGKIQGEVFKGVSVTPLLRVHSSTGENYFEEMYAIKRFR